MWMPAQTTVAPLRLAARAAGTKAPGLRASGHHLALHFMARHDVGLKRRKVCIDDVQIGATYAAGQHPNHQLMILGLWDRSDHAVQAPRQRVHRHGPHRAGQHG